MKSMHLLLDEAERAWREDVRRDFPLRSDTPVIKKASAKGRDWTFSTDLRKIFADISGDESLQKKFETIVAKYWDGSPEELARETLHYLLHHELYHPLEAPFSVAGKDNDKKRIHQAIRRGILQAEPKLSPLEVLAKVQASQNIVKDFILDNRFAIDNKTANYVKEGVIPIWDLLELQETPEATNCYTVTRFLYGALYGPKSTHEFFEEKAGKDGTAVAEKALAALIGKDVQLPKKKSLAVKEKPSRTYEQDEQLQDYVAAARSVFSGDDRYEGIKRLMAVLGPYVEKNMHKGRSDMQGEASCSSPQDILQDLLDDMEPQEQAQFIQGLAQEKPGALEQAASNMAETPDSAKPWQSSSDEMKNLDMLAAHEFYKRNHPSVRIIGGNKVGENLVVGRKQYWGLKRTSVLTEEQLARINLQRIEALQRRTRLPWLIDLGNGTFRLNEYELKEKEIKDIVYVDAHIDVPDVVEFYLDSSGSMFGGNTHGLNDGSRWDMLSHVMYGFVDALQQGGKLVGKQTKMRIHNFADRQVDSQLIPVEQFWSGDTAALKTLFKPENGYSVEDISIAHYNDGRKRAYVVVTDGQLVIAGRTEREAGKMKAIAQNRNNHVVLFEIGGTYDLGNAVRNNPSIVYHQVHDKDKMLQAGLEVLLSKREEMQSISGVPKILRGDF